MCFLKVISRPPKLKFLAYGAKTHFISLFSTLSSVEHVLNQKPVSPSHLTSSINFTKLQRSYVETRISNLRSPDTPLNVLKLLQKYGFSESQILATIRKHPSALFTNAEEILKPKLDFFQQLGIVGADLGDFISRDPIILNISLEKTLVPCVEILRNIISASTRNKEFTVVLKKCGHLLPRILRLRSNIAFFEGCGIVGSQMSLLLERQPRLMVAPESWLRDVFTRAIDLGFVMHSEMFPHALLSLSAVSVATGKRKAEIFRTFGFTDQEIRQIFSRAPGLFKRSEDKLKTALDFYLSTVQLEKSALIRFPPFFTCSMEGRIVPRYRVLKMIKSKKLMKKQPSLGSIVNISEVKFLQKFVFAFEENAEELLMVYKGHSLESTSEH